MSTSPNPNKQINKMAKRASKFVTDRLYQSITGGESSAAKGKKRAIIDLVKGVADNLNK